MRLARIGIAACLAVLIQPCAGAFADGVSVAVPVVPSSVPGGGAPGWTAPRGVSPRVVPELAVPAGGGNYASTLEIGSYNKVFQAQNGSGNVSNVGIIKGYANSVGVLQNGNNLKSNVALINTQGLAVGVIQPNGSAPVNVLIARLPGGGLLIKR